MHSKISHNLCKIFSPPDLGNIDSPKWKSAYWAEKKISPVNGSRYLILNEESKPAYILLCLSVVLCDNAIRAHSSIIKSPPLVSLKSF